MSSHQHSSGEGSSGYRCLQQVSSQQRVPCLRVAIKLFTLPASCIILLALRIAKLLQNARAHVVFQYTPQLVLAYLRSEAQLSDSFEVLTGDHILLLRAARAQVVSCGTFTACATKPVIAIMARRPLFNSCPRCAQLFWKCALSVSSLAPQHVEVSWHWTSCHLFQILES